MAVQLPMFSGLGVAPVAPFLPLNQPIIEPRPRARAIKQEPLEDSKYKYESNPLHKLLYNLPQALLKRTKSKSTTSEDDPYDYTTPQPPVYHNPGHRFMSKPPYQRKVSTFHWNGLEKDNQQSDVEESGIVFMVGVFNLLAVVVYAAYRHLNGDAALPDRVITWQVQKVLDELVLRVHSSDYASELLSRSMPEGAAIETRSMNKNPFEWLQNVITSSLQNNDQNALQRWLRNLKDYVITDVAGTEAARRSVRLNPIIYRPMKKLYAAMTQKRPYESSRAMLSPWINEVSATAVAFGRLSLNQTQQFLTALSFMGETDIPNDEILPLMESILKNVVTESEPHSRHKRSEDEPNHNTVAAALASSLTHSYANSHNKYLIKPRITRRMDMPLGYNIWPSKMDRRVINSKYRYPNLKAQHRMADFDDTNYSNAAKSSNRVPILSDKHKMMESELSNRIGSADTESNTHWSDKWFSLVTILAPVGLDVTTLYARAKARPTCLKSLLCQTNNAWKRVGAVQATVAPFLSVLVSWSLEDLAPHSLGDSLIAIRAGWMGKDCSTLYNQCPVQPAPHPAVKEAASFLNKLEDVATQAPTYSPPMGKEITPMPDISENKIERRDDEMNIAYYKEDQMIEAPQNQKDMHQNYQQGYHEKKEYQPNYPDYLVHKQKKYMPEIRTKEDLIAYYNRYNNEGPMAIPGNQAYLNYKREPASQEKQIVPFRQPTTPPPYKKYDSPERNEALEGSITGSNSVSGMALQDRHHAKPHMIGSKSPKHYSIDRIDQRKPSNPIWNQFFEAGYFGSDVPLDEQKYSPEDHSSKLPLESKTDQNSQSEFQHKISEDENNIEDKPPNKYKPLYNMIPKRGAYAKKGGHGKPYFNIRPTKKYHPKDSNSIPSSTRLTQSHTENQKPEKPTKPHLPSDNNKTKYRYGLRRGLPASNVNGYAFNNPNSKLVYQPSKKWYAYTSGYKLDPHQETTAFTTTTTTTTTTPTTTTREVDPFGPSDAVTDIMRNDLLYEFVRDRKVSIPMTNRRSLF